MKNEKPIFIKNWDELSKIPNESPTHILKVDVKNCNGFLYPKNPKPYNYKLSFMRQIQNQDYYLSTHTFYGHEYKHASKILRACGFNVQLDNWDKKGDRSIGVYNTINSLEEKRTRSYDKLDKAICEFKSISIDFDPNHKIALSTEIHNIMMEILTIERFISALKEYKNKKESKGVKNEIKNFHSSKNE